MRKVLAIFFQFVSCRYLYLGQLLTQKDPDSVEFNTPSPHWHDHNHPANVEALDLTLDLILLEHGSMTHDPQGVLSILLASMVHHSD